MGKKNWGVDTKIRTTSSLMTTNILNTKITEVENKTLDNSKYITTQEFNKLTAAKNQKFCSNIKTSWSVNKNDFDN